MRWTRCSSVPELEEHYEYTERRTFVKTAAKSQRFHGADDALGQCVPRHHAEKQ